MMYVIVDRATGAVASLGQDKLVTAERQAGEGQVMLAYPHSQLLRVGEQETVALILDVEALRPVLLARIDQAGDAIADPEVLTTMRQGVLDAASVADAMIAIDWATVLQEGDA